MNSTYNDNISNTKIKKIHSSSKSQSKTNIIKNQELIKNKRYQNNSKQNKNQTNNNINNNYKRSANKKKVRIWCSRRSFFS